MPFKLNQLIIFLSTYLSSLSYLDTFLLSIYQCKVRLHVIVVQRKNSARQTDDFRKLFRRGNGNGHILRSIDQEW